MKRGVVRGVVFSVVVVFALFLGLGGRGLHSPGSTPAAEAAFPGADGIFLLSQRCFSDGSSSVTIGWVTYNQGTQFVDFSNVNNGFVAGTYLAAGPLPSYQGNITLQLAPNTWYFLRVNTLTIYGWVPSPTVQFLTPNCQPFVPAQPVVVVQTVRVVYQPVVVVTPVFVSRQFVVVHHHGF